MITFQNFFYILLVFFLDFNKNWDAAATDYNKVYSNKRILKRYNCSIDPIACGILFKKKSLLKNGLYEEKLKINEDIELRKRFDKKFYTGRVALPLYRYTMHKDNLTKNKNLKKLLTT